VTSHTRTLAHPRKLEGLLRNQAPTLARHSQHIGATPVSLRGEQTSHAGVPGSECCAHVVREKKSSLGRESPGFLPLCEFASVSANLLGMASRQPSDAAFPPDDGPTAWAGVIAPRRWIGVVAEANEPAFEQPCPERRGMVERCEHLFLHFCAECGRWGAYGYGTTGDRPGRWYCWLHRPDA
jgi:hypothetical protein